MKNFKEFVNERVSQKALMPQIETAIKKLKELGSPNMKDLKQDSQYDYVRGEVKDAIVAAGHDTPSQDEMGVIMGSALGKTRK
jgi:3-oxoacyl-(acyl-carrier-protein) synthase